MCPQPDETNNVEERVAYLILGLGMPVTVGIKFAQLPIQIRLEERDIPIP